MRILHIVTLVTPTGAFGGPVRVAENQCRELIRRGNDVVIVAAYDGFTTPPQTIGQVPARLFRARRLVPGTGFSGISSPSMLRWLSQHATDFDIIHIHLGRDLVTLPAAQIVRRAGVPFVVQPHGMIVRSRHPLARPMDALWTRRTLRRARKVFFLTQSEKLEISALVPLNNLEFLPNGVPAVEGSEHDDKTTRDVLFMARLHSRKRPDVFVQAALLLLRRGSQATFTVSGPDEGMADMLRASIDASEYEELRLQGPVAPENVLARLAQATIYVLPSIDEPFPMSVLEAMSVGTPVIVTDSCGLADHVQAAGAGIVVDSTTANLARAIDQLLADPLAARSAGEAGRNYVRTVLSIGSVVRTLEAAYRAEPLVPSPVIWKRRLRS